MLTPFMRAVGQLGDPRLLGVLLVSAGLSALCFAGLAAGVMWELARLAGPHAAHGAGGVALGVVSVLSAVLVAMALFLPLVVLFGGLFQETVCLAVERRFYPGLPAPRGPGTVAPMLESARLALRVLGFSVVALLLGLVIPGLGLLPGLLLNAWALGRASFVSVAMRRMTRREAVALYQGGRGQVWFQGLLLALLGSVPPLNLLLPVLAPACMVHLMMASGVLDAALGPAGGAGQNDRHKSETWG